MVATEYLTHVEALAAEIASGRLKPGDRLPPQRTFAYERGIAASTANRVYTELLRRGLVVGEVGRGTFVAGLLRVPGTPQGEPLDGRIDLEFNFPTVPEQAALIAASLAGLHRVDALTVAMQPVTAARLDHARDVTSAFLSTRQWRPSPAGFSFTGSGRQSLAAAVSALVPVGARLGVEAVTYPQIKNIADKLGVHLVPIALDDEGLLPDAIAKAQRSGPLSALYVQPMFHNPLGHSMSAARQTAVLRLTEKLDLPIIEDRVYAFLTDEPPLAAQAPDRCLVIGSLSKQVAPGVGLGFVHAPDALSDRVAAAVRSGAWSVRGLALAAGVRLMADGTASEIGRLKRKDAQVRQRIVSDCFGASVVSADKLSYHAWIKLPGRWRSEPFAAAAARANIALTPSSAFAVTPGHAPNAVRIALGWPTHDQLRLALTRLRRLLDAGPDATDVTE